MSNYFKDLVVKQLIQPMGGCIVTNRISVDGLPIKYMYKESASNDLDSGWRFFSGDESQDYLDQPENAQVFDLNTLANYDRSIIPYLDLPFGVELEKDDYSGKFNIVSG